MENWGKKKYVPILVVILLVAFIAYSSRPNTEQVEDKANDLGLQTVTIGVIDQYNSEYFPETSEYYRFIAKQAERDIIEYCNRQNIGIEFDVVFQPVDEYKEMITVVHDCKENGTNLLVGFPSNLALDLCMTLAVSDDDMILMSIGSAQPFGFTWDDTVFRLHPPRTRRAKPLAEIMYELGVRAVIPVTNFVSYEVGAFNEEFRSLGGHVYEPVEYSVDYVERVKYKPEIESIDIDFSQLNNDVSNASRFYPEEEIAILDFGSSCLPQLLNMCRIYPDIIGVQWYSYYETDQCITELEKLDVSSDVRVLSLSPKIKDTTLSGNINQEFRDEFGRDMSLIEANIYDGVWILALSVIAEDSTEILALKDRIPTTAAGYQGLSGLCELDEVGDKRGINYNVWAYDRIENNTRRLLYGFYDYEAGKVNWIKPYN